jgi:diguanylate cyclase (GGDEF)-like protein
LTFFILRITKLIPSGCPTATINTGSLLLFMIAMYICLIKFKDKTFIIQTITYFVIISFIAYQSLITTYNLFLPAWIDFSVLTAYIATNKKHATFISVYAFIVLLLLKYAAHYEIDKFSFLTLQMTLVSFSILGFLISLQLEKYEKLNKEQSKKLEKLALIDELTCVFNRRAFFKIAQKILMQAKRNGKNTALIMMDLDHFKQINDTYGHKAGDEVLKEFTNKIKAIIRENDIFARIGGEEFVLMLYDTDKNKIKTIADKILNEIRQTYVTYEEKTIRFTVSLGVYIIDTTSLKENIQQALINADKALYTAKKTGRDKVEYYGYN